jgi:hypothetical protein
LAGWHERGHAGVELVELARTVALSLTLLDSLRTLLHHDSRAVSEQHHRAGRLVGGQDAGPELARLSLYSITVLPRSDSFASVDGLGCGAPCVVVASIARITPTNHLSHSLRLHNPESSVAQGAQRIQSLPKDAASLRLSRSMQAYSQTGCPCDSQHSHRARAWSIVGTAASATATAGAVRFS